jgi:FAD/FMN-containing dehydrogenase
VVTVEPEPRRLQLDAPASRPLNHAYGTNGIITALWLSTTASVAWQELVVGFDDWQAALEVARGLPGTAMLLNALCLVEAADRGAAALAGRLRPSCLWRAPDPAAGCPGYPAAADRNGCRAKVAGDLAVAPGQCPRPAPAGTHLESHHAPLAQSFAGLDLSADADAIALRSRCSPPSVSAGVTMCSGTWKGCASRELPGWPGYPWCDGGDKEDLDALINQCRELGATIFNPHTLTVEDGGLGVIDADQVAAKAAFDPAGLLNPGKLRGWLSRNRG